MTYYFLKKKKNLVSKTQNHQLNLLQKLLNQHALFFLYEWNDLIFPWQSFKHDKICLACASNCLNW